MQKDRATAYFYRIFPIIAVAAILFLGVCTWSVPRGLAIVILALFGWTFRKRLPCIVSFADRHVVLTLTALAALGFLARIAIVYGLGWHVVQSWLVSDMAVLWHQANAFASGVWLDNKSWGSVLFYGGIVRIFGLNLFACLCANVLVHALTAYLLYLTASKMVGKGGGCYCFGLYFCCPALLFVSLKIQTENLYFLFLSLTFLSLVHVIYENCRMGLLGCVLFPWCAIMCRGEGAIFLILVPVSLCAHCFRKNAKVRQWIYECAIPVIGLFLIGFFVAVVNAHNGVGWTFFCSNDNYWPRLYGATVECGGRYVAQVPGVKSDKDLILDAYLDDHPNDEFHVMEKMKQPQTCARELVPYIEAEINRRWAKMSPGVLAKFLVSKMHTVWGCDYVQLGDGQGNVTALVREIGVALPTGIIVVMSILALLQMRRTGLSSETLCGIVFFVFMVGNAMLLCIAEVSPRYGLSLFVAMNLFSSLGVRSFLPRVT